jgi:hypothetical protein
MGAPAELPVPAIVVDDVRGAMAVIATAARAIYDALGADTPGGAFGTPALSGAAAGVPLGTH